MTPANLTANANHTNISRFRGFSIRETLGAAAVVNFRLGASDGQILQVGNLGANESLTSTLDDAIPSAAGVYVQVSSGTIEGVLYQE